MNIVVSGSKVQVYGEEVSTYKQLYADILKMKIITKR